LLICHSFGLQAFPRIPFTQIGTLKRDAGQLEAETIECAGRSKIRTHHDPLRLQPFGQLDNAGRIDHSCIDQPLQALAWRFFTGAQRPFNLSFFHSRTLL